MRSISRSSNIAKLDPMLDDGTLIIGGRLRHSRLPYQVKHPVILPPSHRVSKMIVTIALTSALNGR